MGNGCEDVTTKKNEFSVKKLGESKCTINLKNDPSKHLVSIKIVTIDGLK